MNQFKHIANLVIPLSDFMDIIDDLRSKDLQVGVDFDFDLVAVAEYDEFNVPLTDCIRFSFKEGKWTTYVILKYS
jgi:hypothetical protein